MRRPSDSLKVMIGQYLLCCQAEGKSAQTVRWYAQKLAYFASFLIAQRLPTELGQISAEGVRSFVRHLQKQVKADENNPRKPTADRPLSAHTVAGYVRTLRAFFSWALKEGILGQNPMAQVKVPKVPLLQMPFFTDEEVNRLLVALRKPSPVGQRNYTMILLLLDVGLRVSELVHAQMRDLNLSEGYLKVSGKGSKERIVPLGRNSQKALLTYVRRIRPTAMIPAEDRVFLSCDGYPLKSDYVYKIVAQACRAAGIEGKRLGPHTCRHTFARSFLTNGGDLLTLQRILGHSSLEVVRLYVNLQTEDLLAQQRRYSPMDTLMARSSGSR